MVLYRKYRFQSLDEMVGQTAVKQTLQAAISSDKLSHAYLFCGPRGTGKTSTARVLAKIVNCEAEGGKVPCNKCSTCLSITDGSSLDVVEMDAASNRGIEDIRALRETIKLAPTSSRKKVYIIDEVHMLSQDAFNALLKTLEEPPSHVLFILATTEVQKLPQTILSRVQRLNFQMATTEEMCEALRKVVKSEKIEITDEALLTLAKLAGGSFRDGIKFLDQLSSFGKIDQEVVEKNLGTGVYEGTYLLIQSLAEKDTSEALKKLVSQLDCGIAAKELCILILGLLQQLLLIKNSLGDQLVKSEVGIEKYTSLEALAQKFTIAELLDTVNCFQKSLEQSRYVSLPTLPLELAVIESCGIEEESKSKQSLRPNDLKQSLRPNDLSNLKIENRKMDDPLSTLKLQDTTIDSPPSVPIIAVSSVDASEDIQKISEKWGYILETVRSCNYALEALLRSSRIVNCEGKRIILEVPYSFHQRIIETPKSRDLVESIFSDILQRTVSISTVLSPKVANREELTNVEVAADDEIVRIASEIFNSEIVN